MTGKETRTLVLGHLQRGGSPTTFDRLLGLRFGAAAVRFIAEGRVGSMVALRPPLITAVPIEEALAMPRRGPPVFHPHPPPRGRRISAGERSGPPPQSTY